MHRYFNETPLINRHVEEINRRNNEVAQLLEKNANREAFSDSIKENEYAPLIFNRRRGDLNSSSTRKETFSAKSGNRLGKIIDTVMTIILIIIFIVFMGYLAYICFVKDPINEISESAQSTPFND
jgi:hypothetical protein